MNKLRPASPTEFLLIAVNMVPLAGALLWEWKVFDVLLLYWFENVIIGLFNVFKMLSLIALRGHWLAIPIVPFFVFHYGIFCQVHGVFIFVLFARPEDPATPMKNHFDTIFSDLITQPMFLMALGGLLLSHAFSFFFNFMIRREVYKTNLLTLMSAPYERVVVMHLTLLIGSALVLALGEPIWALALMTLLKTWTDLRAHRRSHRKLQNAAETDDTVPPHDAAPQP